MKLDDFANTEAIEEMMSLLDSAFDVMNGRRMQESINTFNWPDKKQVSCSETALNF